MFYLELDCLKYLVDYGCIVDKDNLPKGWIDTNFKYLIKKIPLTGKKIKQKEYQKNGTIPIIDQGQDHIGGYTDDDQRIVKCNLPVIVFGDHTKSIKFIECEFVAGADGIKVLEPNPNLNPKLLYYFMQAIRLPDKGYARHYQYLEKALLCIPPLNEQKRIVSKIESIFSQIDAARERLVALQGKMQSGQASLAALKSSVLKRAFEGRLVPQDPDDEPAEAMLRKIHGNFKKKLVLEKDGLPKGWIRINLNSCSSKITDGTHSSPKNTQKGEIPYITAKNIRPGKINLTNITYISKNDHQQIFSRCNPTKGDVLYTKDGTIGYATVNELDFEFSLLSSVSLIKPKTTMIDPYYLQYFLNSPANYNFITKSITGSALRRIVLEKIKQIPILLPPLKEQRRIVSKIESIFSRIDARVTSALLFCF